MEQPPNTHLAQLNVATASDDLDSPRLKAFMDGLDRVNAIAERSEGFVWRLKDGENATDIQVSDDPRFIVNLSVWRTPEAFEQFVWNTVHKRFYQRRADWFEAARTPTFVMWWVEAGARPSIEEAMARLDDLRANGPSDRAFGWAALPSVSLWRSQRCA